MSPGTTGHGFEPCPTPSAPIQRPATPAAIRNPAEREHGSAITLSECHGARGEDEAADAQCDGGQPCAERRESHPELDPQGEDQQEALNPGEGRELDDQAGREGGDPKQPGAKQRCDAHVLTAILDREQGDESFNPMRRDRGRSSATRH
jgi:hypothetical protein